MATINMPLKSAHLRTFAEENNITFNRLPVVDDIGSLPYSCYDIKLKANELINKDNINICFKKIYTNLIYLVSRSFTINDNIPEAFLGLQPITGPRFKDANSFCLFDGDNNIDVTGFVSSPTSVGILSGYYINYQCSNINGGCFKIGGSELTTSAMTALATTHNQSTVLLTNDGGSLTTNEFNGSYNGVEFTPDVCGTCNDEIIFKALVIDNDPVQSNVLSNTNDLKFSRISTIESDSSSNLMFVLDSGASIIYAYDTTGYLTRDDIYIKKAPMGRILVSQIGGTNNTILDKPEGLSVVNNKLYVFESGSEVSSVSVKVFKTPELTHIETISLDNTVNATAIDGAVTSSKIYTVVQTPDRWYNIVTRDITSGADTTTKLTFITPGVETPRQFKIGVVNPDIAYLLTDKNIYKFHLDKLYLPCGSFDFTDAALPGDYTLNTFYVKQYVDSLDQDELFVTVQDVETLLRFTDSNNYVKILQDSFEDNMYGFDSIKIARDEYVNAFTYNNAFHKILSDHLSILNGLRGKFISVEAVTDTPGFNYTSTVDTLKESGLLETINDIKLNNRIGVNEFVLTAVVNRCVNQICELQKDMLKLIEFPDEKEIENVYAEFDCDGSGRGSAPPDIVNPDPDICIWLSLLEIVVTPSSFSVTIDRDNSIDQSNYTDVTKVKSMFAKMVHDVTNIDIGANAPVGKDHMLSNLYFVEWSEPLSRSAINTRAITKKIPNDPDFVEYTITDIPGSDKKLLKFGFLPYLHAEISKDIRVQYRSIIFEYMDANFTTNVLDFITGNNDHDRRQEGGPVAAAFADITGTDSLSKNETVIQSTSPVIFNRNQVIEDDTTSDRGIYFSTTCTNQSKLIWEPYIHPAPPPVIIIPPTIRGCMDPTALNYNPNATFNDGSCTYPPPDFDPDTVPLNDWCAMYRVTGPDGESLSRDYGEYIIVCMDFCYSLNIRPSPWIAFTVYPADPSKTGSYKGQSFTHMLYSLVRGNGFDNMYLTTMFGKEGSSHCVRGGSLGRHAEGIPGKNPDAKTLAGGRIGGTYVHRPIDDRFIAYNGFDLISPSCSPRSKDDSCVFRKKGTSGVNRDTRFNERWVYYRGWHYPPTGIKC